MRAARKLMIAAALGGIAGGVIAVIQAHSNERALRWSPKGPVEQAFRRALSRQGDGFEQPVLAALEDPDAQVIRRAADLLARCPVASDRVEDRLVTLLSNPDPMVVTTAIHALGSIRSRRATRKLAELLTVPSYRDWAAWALGAIHGEPFQNTRGPFRGGWLEALQWWHEGYGHASP